MGSNAGPAGGRQQANADAVGTGNRMPSSIHRNGPEVPFRPSRQVPDDAPLLERVVALAGRNPGWPPG